MATYVELIVGDIPGFDAATTKLVTVKGQLDESNVDEQAKKIYQILDAAPASFSLILNFAELEYMNSKAIGYLTDWYTRLSDKQGKILIVQPRENILDILQVVGLTQLIQTYASMDEARLILQQGGAPAGTAPAAPAAPTAEQPAATPEVAPAAPTEAAPTTPPAAPAAPAPEAPSINPTVAAPAPTPEAPAAPEATPAAPVEAAPEATPVMPTIETSAPAAPTQEAPAPEAPAAPEAAQQPPVEGEEKQA